MCIISKTPNGVKIQKPPCTPKYIFSKTPNKVKQQKPSCTPKCSISKTPNRVKQQNFHPSQSVVSPQLQKDQNYKNLLVP